MGSTDAGLPPDAEREIERFLDDWLVEENVPGASVAVFDDEEVLYATGLGARELGENAPATADTRYNVGSVTKTLTAIAVLQSVERGELALDDAVRGYVPYLHDVPGDPITVRELLSHSSGMPADSIVWRENVADRRDLRRHVDGAADRRVVERPPFTYYNSGYKVLGELIAAIDGRSYADYVEAEVLAPLGMADSSFDQTVLQTADDTATGYRPAGDDRVPAEEPLRFGTQPADGGLVSSVSDLGRLLRCLLNDGELDGRRTLDAETVGAMTSQQTSGRATIDGDERGYGYGLFVEEFLGERLVGHPGRVAHSEAYAGALAERGLGVALAANTAGVRVADHAQGVLAIAAGEQPVEAVPGLALREKLAAVAGTYEAYRGPTATVEAAGGHVTIDLSVDGDEDDGGEADGEDEPIPAFPESVAVDDYSFYTVRDDGRCEPVEFRETDDGLMLLFSGLRLDRT